MVGSLYFRIRLHVLTNYFLLFSSFVVGVRGFQESELMFPYINTKVIQLQKHLQLHVSWELFLLIRKLKLDSIPSFCFRFQVSV